ncbi:MAG: YidC/Oxa1 family membrane protein insertase [Burkholderiales bacterium]|nr:YidC/Oxa1 family membrane protein insertase [Burkholderiales bacterium]
MLTNIWDTVLYKPLLNALAFLVSIIPGGDVGIAVIILTILVKAILFPFSQKSIESQIKMNLLAPELKKIKEGGASKEEQARQTFDLYKQHKTNPFSGCLLVLVQIPIIFALYYVFLKGLNLENGLLYSFIKAPEYINTVFLGILDLSTHSLVLALLAGVSQYFQAILMPKPAVSESKSNSFQDNLTQSMQTQMKYVFPFIVAFIAYRVSGAVALYWITSNIFAIGQQMYANKKRKVALEIIK